jgi:hypothetical protein
VEKRMLAKIAESGLNAEDAQRLKFKPSTSAPEGIFPNAAGFLIPYFTIEGKVNCFSRYRYLEPVHSPQNKLLRYMQPAGLSPEVYFPPLTDWIDYFSNHSGEARSVVITEGELKADCGAKYGVPTVGLGGVWNFKSKSHSLIPSLKNIDWQDATVYIVFDSDAVNNVNVLMAENALAREMLECGARVRVVRLPKIGDGKKTGMDDYIVARGAEDFYALLEATEPWLLGRQLHELNERVVFVHDPGMIIETGTYQRMTVSTFYNVYAPYIWDQVHTGKGGKQKVTKKEAAKEWVKWAGRGEVARTTYKPGEGQITEDRELNTWAGWGLPESVIRPGNTELWVQLLDYLFEGLEPANRKWVEQWFAYPIQHPGVKLYSAVVVWGLKQGVGKTLVGHTMARLYGRNFIEIEKRDLINNFNAWAECRQFVMGDEITGDDKRDSSDRMKSVITRNMVTINAKFIPEYTVPDCINYYFTSNHPDSFFVEDNDRRYFIHEVKGGALPSEFYRAYDRWYRSDAVGALMHRMRNLDLKGFNPTAPAPWTESKKAMIEVGRSEVSSWVARLKDSPEEVLKNKYLEVNYSLMTTEELFALYDPEHRGKLTRPGLSRALRSGGFNMVNSGSTLRIHPGLTLRLWALKEELMRLTPAQLTALYKKERGI